MTESALHPIQLEQLFFVKSVVESIPEHTPIKGQPTATPENAIRLDSVPDEQGLFSFTMKTVVNQALDKASPYFIDMECVAILRVDDTLNDEETKRGLTITGHSVAFGAIREAVAWLTSRQAYGPLMLGLSVLQAKPSKDKSPKPES